MHAVDDFCEECDDDAFVGRYLHHNQLTGTVPQFNRTISYWCVLFAAKLACACARSQLERSDVFFKLFWYNCARRCLVLMRAIRQVSLLGCTTVPCELLLQPADVNMSYAVANVNCGDNTVDSDRIHNSSDASNNDNDDCVVNIEQQCGGASCVVRGSIPDRSCCRRCWWRLRAHRCARCACILDRSASPRWQKRYELVGQRN